MSLEDILKKVNKQFNKEIAIKGIGDLVIERIPFTSPRLNYETYGGIPRGRVSMFVGKESSGKTTTALDILKNAQIIFKKEYSNELVELENKILENTEIIDTSKDRNKVAKCKEIVRECKDKQKYLEQRGPLKTVYFDAENTIDSDWAKKLGVDVDDVFLFRLHNQTAEQFLDQVLAVASEDDVGLIVIDSIAVLVPQLTYDESLEQKSMGGNAKVVTDFVNKVCPKLSENNITCIIINQARDDFKNPYSEFSIPCGNALKLACSLTLSFQKGNFVDESGSEQKKSFDRPQGNVVWARILKTKICKPDRRVGFYTLHYDYGVDVVSDTFPLAVEPFKIITKAGSWYTILNPETGEPLLYEDDTTVKFQGTANIIDFLRNNPDVFNMIYDYINEQVHQKETANMTISEEIDKLAIKQANGEDVEVPMPNVIPEDIIIRNTEEGNDTEQEQH